MRLHYKHKTQSYSKYFIYSNGLSKNAVCNLYIYTMYTYIFKWQET